MEIYFLYKTLNGAAAALPAKWLAAGLLPTPNVGLARSPKLAAAAAYALDRCRQQSPRQKAAAPACRSHPPVRVARGQACRGAKDLVGAAGQFLCLHTESPPNRMLLVIQTLLGRRSERRRGRAWKHSLPPRSAVLAAALSAAEVPERPRATDLRRGRVSRERPRERSRGVQLL